MVPQRIPVTIVTGFLGSGKTTLLNYLLTGGQLGRVAALVNDFGSINIDAMLVSAVADEVVALANGCICCTINGDLFKAAERVLALQPTVDSIVVETTGLADPLPVGLTFLQTTLKTRTSLDAVITVVDCASFALDLFKSDAAMAQIVHADLIALNKIDLVDEEAVASLARRIAVIKPRARTVRTVRGQIPRSIVTDPFASSSLAKFIDNPQSEIPHLRNDGFTAHTFSFQRPLVANRFQQWLDDKLPRNVFRGKGIVRFESGGRFVFQLCGSRTAFEPHDGSDADCQLVFLGRDIDEVALRCELESCLLDVGGPSTLPYTPS